MKQKLEIRTENDFGVYTGDFRTSTPAPSAPGLAWGVCPGGGKRSA